MSKCMQGEFGKTPQFWSQYMSLVDRQHLFRHALSTNDFQLRLSMWRELLPLCFATNRVHYSRYGTYNLKSLECLNANHPGAREESLRWVYQLDETRWELDKRLIFFFYLYHHKNNKKKKLINITMSHSQRERTQSYRAPIANDTYNSTMISK